jgi:hypothetical protein
METKYGIAIAASFILGAGAGIGATYLITKKECDKRTQIAIDEMKEAHKKIIEELKQKGAMINEIKEKQQKESEESKDVRIDKPSIAEMSSIIHSSDSDNSRRTNYSVSAVKESIRNIVEKEEKDPVDLPYKKEQAVIDCNTYTQLSDSGYFEKDFTYDTDTESWKEWGSDAEYDPTDLPFDPDDVIWDDNEQCYIADRGNKSIYILEKV